MTTKFCPFNPTGKCVDCLACYEVEGKRFCRLIGHIAIDDKVTVEAVL